MMGTSATFVLAPLALGLAALAVASRPAAARVRLLSAVAWAVALVQLGLAVKALNDGGLIAWSTPWSPETGVNPLWRMEGLGALCLALSATALPGLVHNSVGTPNQEHGDPSLRALALSGVHFCAGLMVAADDLLSLALAILGMSLARQAWLAGARSDTRPNAGAQARMRGSELVVGAGSALVLLLTVGAAHQAAAHGQWSANYDDLAQLSFQGEVQAQSLVLLLLALAPALCLWPLGALGRGLVGCAAPAYLRLLAPLCAALALARAAPALAPRITAEWLVAVLAWALIGGVLSLLLARDAECGGARAHAHAPLLLTCALVPGIWGEQALCLATLALALQITWTAAPRAAEAGWLQRAADSALPGSVAFAALAATWVAMRESVQVFTPRDAVLIGLALGVLAWVSGRKAPVARAAPDASPVSTPATQRVRGGLALAIGFAVGCAPQLALPWLAPHAQARAQERSLRRCADVELHDLRRTRLRRELSLGCSNPQREIENFYDPPTFASGSPDETERMVSDPAFAPTPAPGPRLPQLPKHSDAAESGSESLSSPASPSPEVPQ